MSRHNFLYKMYWTSAKVLLLANVDEYSFANASDTRQMWKWLKEHYRYFLQNKKISLMEKLMNKAVVSNPHRRAGSYAAYSRAQKYNEL